MISLITRIALSFAHWMMPPSERGWLVAMEAEMRHATDDSERLAWAVGCVSTAMVRHRPGEGAYVAMIVLHVAALIIVDWNTVRTEVSVGMIVYCSVFLSVLRPSRLWLHAGWVGGGLFAAHAASDLTGLARPFYQTQDLTATEWCIIASVIIPALWGSYAGERIGRGLAVHHRRSATGA